MIEVKGLEELQTKLKSLQNIEKKTKPLMQTLGNILQNEIEASFENESSPFGQKWKPLSSVTVLAYYGGGGIKNLKKGNQASFIKNGKRQSKQFLKKFGAGGSKRILRQTGALADKWITKASNQSASVSNNASAGGFPYGLTHQFGTKSAFGKGISIPARPFLPVDKSGNLPGRVKDVVKKVVIKFVEDGFK